MNQKELKELVEELDLERILNIIHFKSIDDWVDLMDKRWKGRVKKRDLLSFYKWIKDTYAKFAKIEERLDKLENPNSDNPLVIYYSEISKKLAEGLIECPKCHSWFDRGTECPRCQI